MRFLKTALAIGLVAATTVALALPQYLTTFKSTYKPSATSALGKAGCKVCHVSANDGGLNAYGKDIQKAIGKDKKLTAAILHKTDSLDSDKDGAKNAAEIKAGTLPGDAKSKPGATKKPTAKKPVMHKKPAMHMKPAAKTPGRKHMSPRKGTEEGGTVKGRG